MCNEIVITWCADIILIVFANIYKKTRVKEQQKCDKYMVNPWLSIDKIILLYFCKTLRSIVKFNFWSFLLKKTKNNYFPPGSKSEALQLGVHLILSYFIKIWILSAETFFLFGWVVGGWMPTFWFFKSLDIKMVYTLGVYVYI